MTNHGRTSLGWVTTCASLDERMQARWCAEGSQSPVSGITLPCYGCHHRGHCMPRRIGSARGPITDDEGLQGHYASYSHAARQPTMRQQLVPFGDRFVMLLCRSLFAIHCVCIASSCILLLAGEGSVLCIADFLTVKIMPAQMSGMHHPLEQCGNKCVIYKQQKQQQTTPDCYLIAST